MSYSLCVIAGDGIGREVVPPAVAVLEKLLPGLRVVEAEAGWECFQKHGVSVPEATLDRMRECGAGLFGAVVAQSQGGGVSQRHSQPAPATWAQRQSAPGAQLAAGFTQAWH